MISYAYDNIPDYARYQELMISQTYDITGNIIAAEL